MSGGIFWQIYLQRQKEKIYNLVYVKISPLKTATGGDGRLYTLLQTQGQYNGIDGIFEYITNDVGQVTHQRFIPGGTYTGFPNQVVPKGGY